MYIEHLSVKDSTAEKYSQDEFQELKRQNNRLCDEVLEMKNELKELKGEAQGIIFFDWEYYFLISFLYYFNQLNII